MHLGWLSSRYASGIKGIDRPNKHFLQVLAGGVPFPELKSFSLGWYVPCGERPAKPEEASAIGFSDSLWDFTECCWSGEIESRPKVGEVVTHLGEVAAKWDRLMPAGVRTESDASWSEDDSEEYGEFRIRLSLVFPIERFYRWTLSIASGTSAI